MTRSVEKLHVMELYPVQQFGHGTPGVVLPQMWINLGLQFLILGLVVLALVEWHGRRLGRHGTIMAVATMLAVASTLLVMIPVFNESLSDLLSDVQMGSLRAQINLIHGGVGIAALLLTGAVTGRYAYGRFRVGKGCYGKNLMRVTVGVWLVAILFGVLVFLAQALAWE